VRLQLLIVKLIIFNCYQLKIKQFKMETLPDFTITSGVVVITPEMLSLILAWMLKSMLDTWNKRSR